MRQAQPRAQPDRPLWLLWLAAALTLAIDVAAAERRPNVLLLLTDQHQADAFSGLGGAKLNCFEAVAHP